MKIKKLFGQLECKWQKFLELTLKLFQSILGNIFKENELERKSTSSKMELVQNESGREIKRKVDFYNLDAIISVGYRINSKNATAFRKWATKTLKEHIVKGYSINENILKQKQDLYLKVLEDVKKLSNDNNQISNNHIIDLIKTFSSTWFNLESYDKQNLPTQGNQESKKDIYFKDLSKELCGEIDILKKDLMNKKEATNFFAQEKEKKSLEGILGNVFQSVFGEDIYKTVEDRASHLLYFIVKNHPFNDGNKRTGAFSFIWFLQKMDFSFY